MQAYSNPARTWAIVQHILSRARERAGERPGQAVFNVAHAIYPERADALRGSDVDPFYHDGRAWAFLSALLGGSEDVETL